jgi:membrane-associated protease RseP (regulator of RpoE activity)
MILIFVYLIHGLYNLIVNPSAIPAIALVVPGIKIPGSPVFIPFWYGIISLFLVILVHEASHGVLSRVYNLKINKTGVGMFAIFPIAFVEPDEKKLRKKSKKQQLSIFAAGPFSNIILAVVVFFIATYAVLPAAMSNVDYSGVEIRNFEKGYPAEASGLEIGNIITSVNGIPVQTVENFTFEMDKLSLGDSVLIGTAENQYMIQTQPSPINKSQPYVGVYISQGIDLKQEVIEKYGAFLPWIWFYLFKFLQWLIILSAGIGLANLLPLGPVDGGRMLLTGLSRFFKNRTAAAIWKQVSYITLLLLILNFLYPYFKMFL